MDMRFLAIRAEGLHQERFWGNNLENILRQNDIDLCLKITDKYIEIFTNLQSRYYESGARVVHIINDR